MRLRVCPPMLFAPLKEPATRILPSDWTAMESTWPFAFGLKESARPVMASSRAMRLRVCPPMLVKPPPAKILPSAWTAIVSTSLFAFGLKVMSSVPSVLSRAICFWSLPRQC